MAKLLFGEALGEVLRVNQSIDARNIRGGTISAQELILAGGTTGLIRSENYDPDTNSGWAIYGDGSATFGSDVTVGGTITGALFQTAASGERLVIDGTTGDSFIRLYNTAGTQVGQMGWTSIFGDDAVWLYAEDNFGFQISGDTDSRIGAGNKLDIWSTFGPIGFSVQASTWQMNDDGQFLSPDGNASLPSLSFIGDTDTGIYRNATNQLGVTAGSSVASFRPYPGFSGFMSLHFNNDGDTFIGGPASDSLQLVVNGGQGIGLSSGAVHSAIIRDSTTGSAANLFIASSGGNNGRLMRSTSSLKYKEGWEFADEDVLASLDLPTPIVWEDKNSGTMLGFGTEHIQAVLDAATQDLDDEGNPDNYDVRSLVAILSAKIKKLEREALVVKDQNKRIAELEAKVAALT
jgi:hypothetical protein